MNGSGPVVAYLLLGILLGYIGGWFLYYGAISVRRKKFVFFPTISGFFVRHSFDNALFNKGYPTAKGWFGVFVGILLVLISTPLLIASLYFLSEAGNIIWNDLNASI